MRIDIGRLKKEAVVYEVAFSPEYIKGEIEEDLRFDAASGEVTFKMVGDSVLATGKMESTAYLPCSRCLTEVKFPILVDVDLCYLPIAMQPKESDSDEIEIAANDPDVCYYKKSGITPDNDLREVLLAEAPVIVHCSEDCKGLCGSCGINLNEASCDCVIDDIDDDEEQSNNAWKEQLKNIKLD